MCASYLELWRTISESMRACESPCGFWFDTEIAMYNGEVAQIHLDAPEDAYDRRGVQGHARAGAAETRSGRGEFGLRIRGNLLELNVCVLASP